MENKPLFLGSAGRCFSANWLCVFWAAVSGSVQVFTDEKKQHLEQLKLSVQRQQLGRKRNVECVLWIQEIMKAYNCTSSNKPITEKSQL